MTIHGLKLNEESLMYYMNRIMSPSHTKIAIKEIETMSNAAIIKKIS